MSCQRGNVNRNRPQKYKNSTAFKNTLHDTSNKTKLINNIQVADVCVRCKDIIEWKIKYKKYKPLSQPRKCVKCDQKTVKQAYHVMCSECGKKLGVCTKCCQKKEVVTAPPSQENQLKLDNEMKNLLQSLPERKRRTFLRYLNKAQKEEACDSETQQTRMDDLRIKLNTLKVEGSDYGDDDSMFNSDEENGSDENSGDDNGES